MLIDRRVVSALLAFYCRYAHRAKSIQNSVKCNEDVNEKVIRELKEEIEKLRQQLLSGGGGGGVGAGGEDEKTAGLQVRKSMRCFY